MTIKLVDCVSIDSKGDGFKIEASANAELIRAKAIRSGGTGFSIGVPVPGTNISLSPEDFEAAKEIVKTRPGTEWPERISTLKSVLDLGTAAKPYSFGHLENRMARQREPAGLFTSSCRLLRNAHGGQVHRDRHRNHGLNAT